MQKRNPTDHRSSHFIGPADLAIVFIGIVLCVVSGCFGAVQV